MGLRALRHQMLIAMGIPACWSGGAAAPPVKPPEPQPIVTASKPVVPQVASFDRKSCAKDAVPESICGISANGPDGWCAGNSASIGSPLEEHLVVTTWRELDKLRGEFLLDDDQTDSYHARLGGDPATLTARCCYTRCSPVTVGVAVALPPGPPPDPRMARGERCIPIPPAGTTVPDANSAQCPQGVELDGKLAPFERVNAERCCYGVLARRYNPGGRPARVDGVPRFAAIGEGIAWHSSDLQPDLEVDRTLAPLDAGVRARLAEAWLESARLEHASIAAFAAVSLRLLALGAPPELVAGAHAAALDEIEHARITFALASRYAGRPLEPVRFDGAAHMTATGGLAALALETFVDGCIGETVAALEAERAAEAAVDPVIAGVLHRIAADETRHAELAWAIVAWCVRAEPSLAGELRAALGDTMISLPPGLPADDDLACHGILGARARRLAIADTIAEVVAPCLAALAA